MSALVSCACGARIKLPDDRANRAFRCPRCKAALAATGQGRIVTSVLTGPRSESAICPICQSAIGPSEPIFACPSCEQTHHRECWAEVGGCATYGCENAPKGEKAQPAHAPLSAWGDIKNCPACGEKIKSIALRCRYCGTDFETVDPLTLQDLRGQVVKEEKLQATRSMVIAMFVLSIVGCPAPILAIVAPCYVAMKRQTIARCGPTYVVMGYSAIGISLLYSILLALFFLFSL
jgi:hypothetical protein